MPYRPTRPWAYPPMLPQPVPPAWRPPMPVAYVAFPQPPPPGRAYLPPLRIMPKDQRLMQVLYGPGWASSAGLMGGFPEAQVAVHPGSFNHDPFYDELGDDEGDGDWLGLEDEDVLEAVGLDVADLDALSGSDWYSYGAEEPKFPVISKLFRRGPSGESKATRAVRKLQKLTKKVAAAQALADDATAPPQRDEPPPQWADPGPAEMAPAALHDEARAAAKRKGIAVVAGTFLGGLALGGGLAYLWSRGR